VPVSVCGTKCICPYGKKLPSIAIFLNNKNDIRPFVEALRDTDFVIDAGLEIVDGSEGNVLASSNQIRVYPINVVKGMEFDVVFFHNIDQTSVDSDLIKRYIYMLECHELHSFSELH